MNHLSLSNPRASIEIDATYYYGDGSEDWFTFSGNWQRYDDGFTDEVEIINGQIILTMSMGVKLVLQNFPYLITISFY